MKKTIAVIGGGPSALAFCSFIDTDKYDVSLYEKNNALGRKFLVAGKGGFNLSHAEEMDTFKQRYTPSSLLENSLNSFTNSDLRAWLKEIGVTTFVGSSSRIYPIESIKPIQVLSAILKRLEENKINIYTKTNWKGWKKNGRLQFMDGAVLHSDFTIFSLGGSSWKITGSEGNWLSTFENAGVETVAFQPSNCAFKINWSKQFLQKNEGTPFKNISVRCGSKTQVGETVVTKFGLEGNGIYALSLEVRSELKEKNKATIYIDFKPTLTQTLLTHKINNSKYTALADILRNDLKITKAQVSLLKELLSKEEYQNIDTLSHYIKNYPLEISGLAPIDEAISTVGGIALNAINEHFELKAIPNNYCIGEMLDYDCPTGGYLLQSCFSMGYSIAKHLNSLL